MKQGRGPQGPPASQSPEMPLRILPEPRGLGEVPFEFTGPQEGDRMVRKSHYIRNAFRTCGEVEPREEELGIGEGMVVSVLRKTKLVPWQINLELPG